MLVFLVQIFFGFFNVKPRIAPAPSAELLKIYIWNITFNSHKVSCVMFVRTRLVTVDTVNASARMRTHILEEEAEVEVEVRWEWWKRRWGRSGGRSGNRGRCLKVGRIILNTMFALNLKISMLVLFEPRAINILKTC